MKSRTISPIQFAVRCLGHFMPALLLAVITLASCSQAPTYYIAGTHNGNYTIHTDVHCERIAKRDRVTFITPQMLHDRHAENLPCCPFCMSSDDAEALHEAISLIRQAEEKRDRACPIDPYTSHRLYLAYRDSLPTSVSSTDVQRCGWEGIAYLDMPLDSQQLRAFYRQAKQSGFKSDYARFVSLMSGNDNYENRKYIYDRCKIRIIYDALHSGGYYEGSYETFEREFVGDDHRENRKRIYDTLRKGGAKVGSTYEGFMARICNDPHQKSRTLIAMLTAKDKRIRVPLDRVSKRISQGWKIILTGNPRPKYLLSIPSCNYEDTVQAYTYHVADVQNVNRQGWDNYASSHPTATVRMLTPDRQHRDIPLSEAHSAIRRGMKAAILYQEDRKTK